MAKAKVTVCIDRDLLDALDYAKGPRASRSTFLNIILAAFFTSGFGVNELFASRGTMPDRYAIDKVRRWKRDKEDES